MTSSASTARSATRASEVACPECGKTARASAVRRRGIRVQGIRVLPDRLRQERASRAATAGGIARRPRSRRSGGGGSAGAGARTRSRRAKPTRSPRRKPSRKPAAKRSPRRRRKAGGAASNVRAKKPRQERNATNDATAIRSARELTRAAQSLGAPDDRRADHRAAARSVVRRLGDEPRHGARASRSARSRATSRRRSSSGSTRARRHRVGGDRRAGLHQLPRRADIVAEGLRALIAAGDAVRPIGEPVQDVPVNVEFVSANPTGPLHVGHGRQAALGDAIASLLECDRLAASRASSTTTTPARRS